MYFDIDNTCLLTVDGRTYLTEHVLIVPGVQHGLLAHRDHSRGDGPVQEAGQLARSLVANMYAMFDD